MADPVSPEITARTVRAFRAPGSGRSVAIPAPQSERIPGGMVVKTKDGIGWVTAEAARKLFDEGGTIPMTPEERLAASRMATAPEAPRHGRDITLQIADAFRGAGRSISRGFSSAKDTVTDTFNNARSVDAPAPVSTPRSNEDILGQQTPLGSTAPQQTQPPRLTNRTVRAFRAPPVPEDNPTPALETLPRTQDQPGAVQTNEQQQELNNLLLQQARGEGGPTAAQALLQRGADDAVRRQIALSTAQTGISGGQALREGQAAGSALQRQALADASILRANEQQAAQQLAVNAIAGRRGQDLDERTLDTQTDLTLRAQKLQERGLTIQETSNQMALELQERLARMGHAVDLEKLRVAIDQFNSGVDLQIAMAEQNFDQNIIGSLFQGASVLGSAAI